MTDKAKNMSILSHQSVLQAHSEKETPALHRFLQWSKDQQPHQFLWLGVTLAGHGCVVTPITIFFVYLTGMNFVLFTIALASMTAALIVNLSAMPTKITIPVLAASVVVDILVVVAAFGLTLAG